MHNISYAIGLEVEGKLMRSCSRDEEVAALASALDSHNAVLIGAGAGLSTSAGYDYGGERFATYFGDLAAKYGFRDMYTGGFAPYRTPEELWAFWSRHAWLNRFAPVPSDTYEVLHDLVKDKDYFVLTTNVDHCFQKAGFDKQRLFYTQGDMGLLQCSLPCRQVTWDAKDMFKAMLIAQGFEVSDDGNLVVPAGARIASAVPTELVPHCPNCGRPATMNLRVDNRFVEDEGWHAASDRYRDYVDEHLGGAGNVLIMELGVGMNSPAVIKFPFWKMTLSDPRATFASINLGEAYAPEELAARSILIDDDIDGVLRQLVKEER